MEDWKRDLDNWLMQCPDDAVECPDCGGTGMPDGYPDPLGLEKCGMCGGTGLVDEYTLKMRDYERAEAERAEEWRHDGEY